MRQASNPASFALQLFIHAKPMKEDGIFPDFPIVPGASGSKLSLNLDLWPVLGRG
jgi:hypothetical protein